MNRLIFVVALLIPLYAQASTVQISIGDAQVEEGNSGTTDLLFNVQREGGSDLSSDIIVPYTVSPSGTHPARPGVDYVAPPANATLRIPAGQSSEALHVPVIGDTAPEQNETLQVTLGKAAAFPAGAYIPEILRVGSGPRTVISADFNGDGVPDLATANLSGNNISILLGKATGGFSQPTTINSFGTANNPRSLAVGDFNGDGNLDIVSADQGTTQTTARLAIFLGDGKGNFAFEGSPGAGTTPISVVAVDLNGDGFLDLVAVNFGSNNVSVRLGNGTGGFAQPVNYAVGTSPLAIVAGDFNGDNHVDLAVVNQGSNNVSLLIGTGTGTFGTAVNVNVGTKPASIVARDFNGDGKLDLAVTNETNNSVSILLGNGKGAFATAASVPVGADPRAIAAGDFDGDGRLDLAVTNYTDNTVSILKGSGAGSFSVTANVSVSGGPNSVITGDFNGDGKLDLAVANNSNNTVAILPGDGAGNFQNGISSAGSFPANGFAAATNFAAGNSANAITVGDFDGDGKLDLAVANFGVNSASVLMGDGAGGFAAPLTISGGGNPTGIVSGDFNNDGKLDFATSSQAFNNVYISLGDGAGGFATSFTYTIGGKAPQSIVAADIEQNGSLDLITANRDSNSISVVGPLFYEVNVGSSLSSVVAGDFDADGDLDLAAASSSGNLVSILKFDPATGYTLGSGVSTGAGPVSIATGDIDGDGNLDLVTANSEGNSISVLIGDGADNFTSAGDVGVGRRPDSVIVADFDGDGFLDIAVANQSDNTVSILRGNGLGDFASRVNFAVGNQPNALIAADLDGDGDLDLAVANQDGTVSILLNQSAQPVTILNGGTATGTILDDDPAPPIFRSITEADSDAFVISNSPTISKRSGPTSISISGSNASYRINGGAYTSSAGTINNGDKVNLKILSAVLKDQIVNAVLTIGSQTSKWSVTTGTDTAPYKFVFPDHTPSSRAGVKVLTNARSIEDISVPVSISVSGSPSAAYSINGGAFTSATGTVNPGDTIQLSALSPTAGTSRTVSVTVGSYTTTWTISTSAAP